MKSIKFRYKSYLVKISEYGITGSCTELFEEYTQVILGIHFKRKRLLILSTNYGHIASLDPISNEMALRFADAAIAKLNAFNEGNRIKIDWV